MALTAEVGDRIKAQLEHCNFMVDCVDGWFDDDKVLQADYLQEKTKKRVKNKNSTVILQHKVGDLGLLLSSALCYDITIAFRIW